MIGTVIGGCRLVEEIGGGGFGTVYKAVQLHLDRTVAVKLFRQDADVDHSLTSEVRTAAKLEHPGIMRVYASGRDGNVPFVVMEYVEGGTLDKLMTERGPLPIDEALTIGGHIAEALDYAHSHNVVHSDLNPRNVMLSGGRVVVGDFLGCNLRDCGGRSVVGVPEYVSPEHARGLAPTEKSDIYSLGIILYEMLTGKRPLSGESPSDTLFQQISTEPELPSKLNPLVPPRLDRMIMRMLAKNPGMRYGSCSEVLGEIEALKRDLSLGKIRAARKEKRPVSRALVAALTVVLACLGGVGYLVGDSIAEERKLDALVRSESAGSILEAAPALEVSVAKRYEREIRQGERMLKLRQYRAAATAFHRASKLRPDHVDPHLFLASIFIERGSFRTAEVELDVALKLEPNNSQAQQAMDYVRSQLKPGG